MQQAKTENTNPFQPIQDLLTQLGLPKLTPESLTVIRDVEGSTFKDAVIDAGKGKPNADEQMKYLKLVITACSPATKRAIEAAGYCSPPLEDLISLVKREGMVFAMSVRTIINPEADSQDASTSRAYLKRTLHSAGAMKMNTAPDAGARLEPPMNPIPGQAAPKSTQSDIDEDRFGPPAGFDGNARSAAPPANTHNNKVRQLPTREAPSSRAGGDDTYHGTSSTPAPTPDAAARKYTSFHLYGGKAALCFSVDTTRRGDMATMRIEGAPSRGERSYDWDKKISFQLTVAEMPLVFGVLYGFIKKIELSGHGETNDKAFAIDDQEGKFFLSLKMRGNDKGSSGSVFAVPVPPKDTFGIMATLFSQIKANTPGLSDPQLMMLIKRVCEKTPAAPAYQPRAAAQ